MLLKTLQIQNVAKETMLQEVRLMRLDVLCTLQTDRVTATCGVTCIGCAM